MKKIISFWLTAIMLATSFIVGVAAEDSAFVEENNDVIICDTCEHHEHEHEEDDLFEDFADDFEMDAKVSCYHGDWQYYDITETTHTRRCGKCGNTYPNISHNSRTVPCTQSYTCECGKYMSSIPHNTQWRSISSGRHQLVCTNSYCSYVVASSVSSCTYSWAVGVPVMGGVHKGYGVCSTCGDFTYNSSYDRTCQGTNCPYCK